MSLALLFPAGLLALAALLLPILLHLQRRPPEQVLPFAALRWLGLQARPSRKLRLQQWLLLLVRLLLLATLALLLAGPLLHGLRGNAQPVRAVVPGLSPPPADDRHRDVWLAEGFPPIQPGQLAPDRHQPVSSLLRQLDAELPSGVALQVQVPARLLGVDGQVPRLSRPVDWQVQPSPEEAPAPQEAALPRLVIRHDPAHADAARWLRAVALAWQAEEAADVAPTDVAVTAADANTVIAWLSEAPLPDALASHPGVVLLATPPPSSARVLLDNGQGRALLVAGDAPGRLHWALPLTPASAPLLLEADFPQRLLQAVRPSPLPAVADAADNAPRTGAQAPAPKPAALAPWLALLSGMLWLLERVLASLRPRTEVA